MIDDTSSLELVVTRALAIAGQPPKEIERSCWLALHENRHGVLPSEYDVRDTDEELYLEVLRRVRLSIQMQLKDPDDTSEFI